MNKQKKHTQTIPIEEVENTLYAKRKKIHPRIAWGLFSKLKASSGLILLSIYYIFPWIQWNGHQAVLFDLPAQQFHIFGLILWPQDLIYLSFILIIAALSLFFFTTLAGRLWCGFACPQTVWTDAFLWMERLVEGDRPKQIKLEQSPMNFRKLRLMVTKQFIWIVFSLFTGFTFVGYFVPIHELLEGFMTLSVTGWALFWTLFYAFATYGNAGFLREQICIYMCPYARFQSAMFDKDTMIIAYDEGRGEPRGKLKKDQDNSQLGDCIDCTVCVQVCPVGIDIRDGLQYQCISCSACIDACDEIMDKINKPRGLVRYTTENVLNGKETHILRPRIMIYGAILIALTLGLLYVVSQRVVVEIDVIRDRNALYRETFDGMIENIYTLKLMNMDNVTHTYELNASGIEGLELQKDVGDVITVEPGNVVDLPVRLVADPANLTERSTEVFFEFKAIDDPDMSVIEDARFLGPH